MKPSGYSLYKRLTGIGYEEAIERVTNALQAEGFGILTQIDVRETMKQKLDVEFRPYVILGACNPPLAHRALTTEDSIGLLLPCNVVVAAADEGSEVAIASPRAMLAVAEATSLEDVAAEAEERLRRVLEAV